MDDTGEIIPENNDNEGGGAGVPNGPANVATLQAQLDTMQHLMTQQMQLMQLQIQNNTNNANAALPPQPPAAPTVALPPAPQQQPQSLLAPTPQLAQTQQAQAVSTVKRVTIPSGRYNMNSHELRTYTKDCNDFKKLTACTDEQAVLQMRLNMDEALKQAVDANYSN